jgi:hypothetical protein
VALEAAGIGTIYLSPPLSPSQPCTGRAHKRRGKYSKKVLKNYSIPTYTAFLWVVLGNKEIVI